MPTTARPVPYLPATLARLSETKTLTHPLVRGFHLMNGALQVTNAIQALTAAAADGSGWVIYLEDDIDIVDDFIGSVARWLVEYASPAVHFYPLGCNARRAMREAASRRDFVMKYPLSAFYGACAVAIRSEDVRGLCRLLSDRLYPKAQGYQEAAEHIFDVHLRHWHLREWPDQLYVLTPVPSLINHMGPVSSLPTGREPGHFTGQYESFSRTWSYRG